MLPPTTLLFLVELAATLILVGIIWFVQVVHYPLFARVRGGGFREYAVEHSRRTSIVVAPLMLIEAAAAVAALVWRPTMPGPLTPGPVGGALALVLLAVIWASTFLLQVPMHRRLGRGFDLAAYRRLVATNWVRTVAWTSRGLLALVVAGGGTV